MPRDYKNSRVLAGSVQKLPCSLWVDTAFVLTAFLAARLTRGSYAGGTAALPAWVKEGFWRAGGWRQQAEQCWMWLRLAGPGECAVG